MYIQKFGVNSLFAKCPKMARNLFSTPPKETINLSGLRYMHENTCSSFVRTNISKEEKIIDEYLATNPESAKDVETLGIRLLKKMKASGRNYVKTEEVRDLVNITGLTEAELSKNFDNIASFLTIMKNGNTSLWFRETPYTMKVNLGKTIAEISPLDRGCSGSVYRIKFPDSRSYVLKNYHGNTFTLNATEGCYAEAAIQKEMTEKGVEDAAKLVISNPENGWIVSEFIDNTYKVKKTGFTVNDFMKKNNLKFDDINGGMHVKDSTDKNILVDYGYIMHHNGVNKKYYKVLEDINTQLSEKQGSLNFEKIVDDYMKNPKDRFKIIQQIEEQVDTEFGKKFYERVKDTPQMKLYTQYSEYLFMNCCQRPTDISKANLEKLMHECGFNTNIDEFIGNQDFYNNSSIKFKDYFSSIFEEALSKLSQLA